MRHHDGLVTLPRLRGLPVGEALVGHGAVPGEALGLGAPLGVDPDEDVPDVEAPLLHGHGRPVDEPGACEGEEERAWLEHPEDFRGHLPVPALEPQALGGVEAHAPGKVLHRLAPRGALQALGVPGGVHLVEEVRRVGENEVDRTGRKPLQHLEGIAQENGVYLGEARSLPPPRLPTGGVSGHCKRGLEAGLKPRPPRKACPGEGAWSWAPARGKR